MGPPLEDTRTGVDVGRRLAPGTVLAARYTIGRVLGVGGMGVVYLARDEELVQDVAVKVLRPDLGTDPEWIERFRRELILAREVTHKNVVRIHDIGESDGLRFLTMRYVAGRSLMQVLDQDGPLPVERAVAIVRQVAEALQRAHEAGVVHRDLKPGNILLEEGDVAYITDFGIARSLERGGPTATGMVVGTPDYLSPEQFSGDPVDGRSDLYALGIVFYEMLTGQSPFSAESNTERLAQRLTGQTRDITQTGVRVPRYVRAIIRRCLERSPARRYAEAKDLVADLDRGKAKRTLPRMGAWTAAAVALVLIASGWALTHRDAFLRMLRGRAAETSVPVAAHRIAVLPLANDTGDAALAWAATGAAEMLSAQLAENPTLRVIDAGRVFRTTRDLQLAEGRYDERAISRLAELLEVESLVAGSIRRAGSTVRIDLRLTKLGPGAPATRHLNAESASEGGLFRVIGDLGRQLHSTLGVAPQAASEAPPPETASVEAARAYAEGRRHLLIGDPVSAAPALERAVAADSGFATALESLSAAYQSLGYQEKALSAAEQAEQRLERGEVRLGYRVRARLGLLRGNPAEAAKIYGELASRYPHDTEALLDLAAAQSAQGDIGQAVATLEKATALDKNDPRAWFLLGKNTILAGDAEKAVNDYLVRALTLHNQLRNEQGQGDVLNAQGVAYQQLGDHAQAIEKYTASAAIRRRLGDDRGLATNLKNRAQILTTLGRNTEAEVDLRQARALHEKIGDRAGLADVLNDFGALNEGRGDYAAARQAFQEALKIRRDLGDERQLAESHDNVGYVFFLQGEYDNAFVYWKQALESRRKIGEKGGVVLSMQNMGFLQTAQGRWDQALKSFVEALERSREIDFKIGMAVSFGNIGVLQQYDGRYGAALSSFDQALEVLTPLDDKQGLAEFTLKKAAALLELGRLEDAKAKLDAARPLVEATGNLEQSSDYHVLLAEWHLQRGETDAAQRLLAEAVRQALVSHARAAVLRARLAQAQGAARPPARRLADLSREAESLGEALLRIRAAEALSRAELRQNSVPEAEVAARRALKVAEACRWEAGLYRLHALMAAVLEKKGDTAGAARHDEEARRRLGRLREGLDPVLRASFDKLPLVHEVDLRRAGPTANNARGR